MGYNIGIKEYRKQYYKEHKKEILLRSKNRYLNKKDIILQQHHINHKNRDIRELLVERAKARAKRNNIPFNITIDDIILPTHCPCFNIKLERNIGSNSSAPNSYSLDRIIPKLGYVKGNIRVISHKANCMKNNATSEELRTFAAWILNI